MTTTDIKLSGLMSMKTGKSMISTQNGNAMISCDLQMKGDAMKTYKLNLNKFVPFMIAVSTGLLWIWLTKEILLGLAGM